MKRRTAREKAVQVLFQVDMAGVDVNDAIHMVLEDEEGDKATDGAYLTRLVEGTLAHLPAIDEAITKYLRGWRLDRIANVDRAILRLAFFEIMYETEIPEKVVLNEAVELAKTYSDDQSYRFINGVLSSFLKEHQRTQT